MNQGANPASAANQPGVPAAGRPTAEDSRRWLKQQVWTLPLLDEHSADEILGYGDDGLC
jgi:hypothetical protein